MPSPWLMREIRRQWALTPDEEVRNAETTARAIERLHASRPRETDTAAYRAARRKDGDV